MNHSELSHMAAAVDDSTINIVEVIIIIIIISVVVLGFGKYTNMLQSFRDFKRSLCNLTERELSANSPVSI